METQVLSPLLPLVCYGLREAGHFASLGSSSRLWKRKAPHAGLPETPPDSSVPESRNSMTREAVCGEAESTTVGSPPAHES